MLGKIADRVGFWGSAQWAAFWNDPSEGEKLIAHWEHDRQLTAVVITDPIMDGGNPTALADLFTFWTKSVEECADYEVRVSNDEIYQRALDDQLAMVDTHLATLRRRLPSCELFLSVDGHGLQNFVSRIVNEMLVTEKGGMKKDVAGLKSKRKPMVSERGDWTKAFNKLKGVRGVGKERQKLRRQIKHHDSAIRKLDRKLVPQEEAVDMYRAKAGSPRHQQTQAKFVNELIVKLKEICEPHGVVLLTNPDNIVFKGGSKIYFTQTMNDTWVPIINPGAKLPRGFHGKVHGLLKQGVHIVVQGSQDGRAFFKYIKSKRRVEETGFKNQSRYAPTIAREGVYFAVIPPFENRSRISRIRDRKESVRTGMGMPLASRSNMAFKRRKNGGVSGIMTITRLTSGLVYPEVIPFSHIVSGRSVKRTKQVYPALLCTSDKHIGSEGANWLLLRAVVAFFMHYVKNPFEFRGQPAIIRGKVHGGDDIEASHVMGGWPYLDQHRRNPNEVLAEAIERLVAFVKGEDKAMDDQIIELALLFTNSTMGGSVESMAVILDWFADYALEFFDVLFELSELRDLHIGVDGNHGAGALRRTGMKDHFAIVQRLKDRLIGVDEAGNNVVAKNVRVRVGGVETARIVRVKDLGMDIHGDCLFEEFIDFMVIHDPESNGTHAIINVTRGEEAHMGASGHTHEYETEWYDFGDEDDDPEGVGMGVAVRLPTLQGVTATEVKYGGLPRVQGAVLLIPNRPGDITPIFLSAGFLEDIGVAWLRDAVREELRKMLGDDFLERMKKPKPDSDFAEGTVGEEDGGGHESKPE